MKGGTLSTSVQVYLPPRALKSEIVRYFGYSSTHYFFTKSSFREELEKLGIHYDTIRNFNRLPYDVTQAIYQRYNIANLKNGMA